jgi:hypothetical protein
VPPRQVLLEVVTRDLGIDRGRDGVAADLALRRQPRPVRRAARKAAERDQRCGQQARSKPGGRRGYFCSGTSLRELTSRRSMQPTSLPEPFSHIGTSFTRMLPILSHAVSSSRNEANVFLSA